MRNAQDDKIVVRRKPETGQWVYCSTRDESDQGSILDLFAKEHRPQYRRSAQTAPVMVGHVGPFPAGCATGSLDGERLRRRKQGKH